jgi:membrane-associated phospholipid phosphatase
MNFTIKRWNFIKLHTLHVAVLLIGIILGGTLAFGMIVDKTPLIQIFDRYFYELISSPAIHTKFLDSLIYPFNFNFLPYAPLSMPSYLVLYILLGLLLVAFFKRELLGWYIFSVLLGTVIAYFITFLDWYFVFRQRPFVSLPNNVEDYAKNIWVNYSSFPSGHARETALYSTLIYNFIPKLKWSLIIFTIFICFSRVYLGAHYPTDAIAGGLIGYLVAKVTLMIANELQIIYQNRKGQHGEKPQSSKS